MGVLDKYISRYDISMLLIVMQDGLRYLHKNKSITDISEEGLQNIILKLRKNNNAIADVDFSNNEKWRTAPTVLTYFGYSDAEVEIMCKTLYYLKLSQMSDRVPRQMFDNSYSELLQALENEKAARTEDWYKNVYDEWYQTVYVAGHMLDRTHQKVNAELKDSLINLGYSVYNPQDNKDINDKDKLQNETPLDLSKRIVEADSKAIYNSDILVFSPKDYAIGTLIELGQVKGTKDLAKDLYKILDNKELLKERLTKVLNQKVYVYDDDIRRTGQAIDNVNISPYYVNAYKLGVINDLTDQQGILNSQEEVLEAITHD